jgi:hypothetical protein
MTPLSLDLIMVPPELAVDRHEIGAEGVIVHAHGIGAGSAIARGAPAGLRRALVLGPQPLHPGPCSTCRPMGDA